LRPSRSDRYPVPRSNQAENPRRASRCWLCILRRDGYQEIVYLLRSFNDADVWRTLQTTIRRITAGGRNGIFEAIASAAVNTQPLDSRQQVSSRHFQYEGRCSRLEERLAGGRVVHRREHDHFRRGVHARDLAARLH
jgi:hypothetical protein